MALLPFAVLFAALFGILASRIAASRGYSAVGWFWAGVLLGPLAILIVFLLPPSDQARIREALATGASEGFRKCPSCAEAVRSEALKCRFCGQDFKSLAPRETGGILLDDPAERKR